MNWISVKDRLPEEGKKVKFLHQAYEFEGEYVGKMNWADCNPFFCSNTPDKPMPTFRGSQNNKGLVTTMNVTHWMPLPEPPKK